MKKIQFSARRKNHRTTVQKLGLNLTVIAGNQSDLFSNQQFNVCRLITGEVRWGEVCQHYYTFHSFLRTACSFCIFIWPGDQEGARLEGRWWRIVTLYYHDNNQDRNKFMLTPDMTNNYHAISFRHHKIRKIKLSGENKSPNADIHLSIFHTLSRNYKTDKNSR